MFSGGLNSLSREEIEKYIQTLNTEHEQTLMKERLKLLEAEKKMLALKNKYEDIENREKNIISALESFKKMQNEGNRNIEVLRGEQLRMIYLKLQAFLLELNIKYPGVLLNSSYKRLITDIEEVLSKSNAKREEFVETGTENDPMRILLIKMQDKRTVSSPREIKVERAFDRPTQIKPVCKMELGENDEYDNLVDKFLNTKPDEEKPVETTFKSTGFDLKEAISPTEDLSEIMKAFDFYNIDDNDDKPSGTGESF